MYIPRHNEETRLPVLHELIRSNPLATLVTMNTNGLFASHIPMVLHLDEDLTASSHGTLRGHVSRANAQWNTLVPADKVAVKTASAVRAHAGSASAVDALAIFSGPQHYITPKWYPGKLEDGRQVPTWNYAVVYASGPIRVIHDAAWLIAHLEALTSQSEATSPIPWKVSDAPADYIQTMIKGIVGFEIPIKSLEGKWKVSQNRTPADKLGVIEGLAALDTAESVTMRDLVKSRS